jgi:hypothetical protein
VPSARLAYHNSLSKPADGALLETDALAKMLADPPAPGIKPR